MQRFVQVRDVPAHVLERNHGGEGLIYFRRLVSHREFAAPIDFVDYSVIPPGSAIGLHQHNGNEEIYFIAAGRPRVRVNGEEQRLEPGSIAIVHSAQSHELINDGPDSVEMFVIQVRTESGRSEETAA